MAPFPVVVYTAGNGEPLQQEERETMMTNQPVELPIHEIAQEAFTVLNDVVVIPPYVDCSSVRDGILYGSEFAYETEWQGEERLENPERYIDGHPVVHIDRLGMDQV